MKSLPKIVVALELGWVLSVCCAVAHSFKNHAFGAWEYAMLAALAAIGVVFLAKRPYIHSLILAIIFVNFGTWMCRYTLVPLWIFGGILIFFGVLEFRSRSELQTLREKGIYPARGSGTDADVRRLVDAGHSIYALRLYREIHGVDLRTAKEAVEHMGQ